VFCHTTVPDLGRSHFLETIPMNRVRCKPVQARLSPSPHHDFLEIQPVVEQRARFAFRHLPIVDREEAMAEAVAAAFVSFVRLKAKGKFPGTFPSTLAVFAILHVRSGRHVGGGSCSTDVSSFAAQRRRGFQLHLIASNLTGWDEHFIDSAAASVLDQVRFKLDWADFLKTLPLRHRRMVRALAQGHQANQVAEEFRVSPSRITQFRQHWQRRWRSFLGETTAAAEPATA
jgi:hypothetical protein